MTRWRIFSWLNRARLQDSARTALAAVVAVLLARLLKMPEYYWAPVSTIVIVQSTIPHRTLGWPGAPPFALFEGWEPLPSAPIAGSRCR
jgi:hypothetical protein